MYYSVSYPSVNLRAYIKLFNTLEECDIDICVLTKKKKDTQIFTTHRGA